MMKKRYIAGCLLGACLFTTTSFAGNEDRVGSAGGQQLLINPWTRSSGWAGASIAGVKGIESMFVNVAGLAFTDQTQIGFSRTEWFGDVDINNLGLAQRVGDRSVIGIGVTQINYGTIQRTTVDNPEGGIGTFSPRNFNFGLSYSQEFSSSIYGGMTVRALSESIADVKATGVSIDAGIMYVTGEEDQIKFGITLKNVGPPMSFSGDGLSYTINQEFLGIDRDFSTEQRSAKFELPALVNIGASYDFIFSENQKLIAALAFTSNSFSRDQVAVGANYFHDFGKASLNLRGGYVYEPGITNEGALKPAYTGPTAGLSLNLNAGESGSRISLDYSFRASSTFVPGHSIGARIAIM